MATSEVAAPTAAPEPTVVDEKAGAGPLKTPLATPASGCVPVERPALTEEQQGKYDWLLEKARGWTDIPAKDDKAGPLTDGEKQWLTRECLIRYLRATKWNEKESEKRLLATLTWRREYGLDGFTWDYISPENETGKQCLLGFDKQARPVQILSPGKQNTDVSPRQVQHLVFMVERCIDLLPPKQDTLCLLTNMAKSKSRVNTAPALGQAREVLNILQTHYPERLGRALVINVPFIVWGFFKLITPFIDPFTREKLKFNEPLPDFIPKEQLHGELDGGELNFEYDHESYWPALQKLCEERRAAQKLRWIAGGQQIGESEDYLKGVTSQGVAAETPAAEAEAETEPAKEGGEAAAA